MRHIRRESGWVIAGTLAGVVGAAAAVGVYFVPHGSSSREIRYPDFNRSTVTTTQKPGAVTTTIPAPIPRTTTSLITLDNSLPTSTSPASDNALNAAESILQAKLSSNVFGACMPRRTASGEGSDVTAALNCVTVRSGPDRQPLVRQFSSPVSMLLHLALNASSLSPTATGSSTNNLCLAGGHYNGSWTSKGKMIGNLICRPDGDRYRIEWTYIADGIDMVADGPDALSLYVWWTQASGAALLL